MFLEEVFGSARAAGVGETLLEHAPQITVGAEAEGEDAAEPVDLLGRDSAGGPVLAFEDEIPVVRIA